MLSGVEPNGVALALFAAAFAACCLSFFTLAGMFPSAVRPIPLKGQFGSLLVLSNLALLAVLLMVVLIFAHETLRWTSVVVAGGLIFLFVPSVFQVIPDEWRDSQSGLLALGALQVSTLVLLCSPLQKLSAM